jgi:hypothetical protein
MFLRRFQSFLDQHFYNRFLKGSTQIVDTRATSRGMGLKIMTYSGFYAAK